MTRYVPRDPYVEALAYYGDHESYVGVVEWMQERGAVFVEHERREQNLWCIAETRAGQCEISVKPGAVVIYLPSAGNFAVFDTTGFLTFWTMEEM